MKNLIKSGTLVLAIVLVSATTVICAPNKEKKENKIYEVSENTADPYYKLEPWMLKAELFASLSLDENLKAEPWMLNADEFVKTPADSITTKDIDMALEMWMMDFKNWKSNRKVIK